MPKLAAIGRRGMPGGCPRWDSPDGMEVKDFGERPKHHESQGCKIIRFSNKEVTGNIERVILGVMNALVE